MQRVIVRAIVVTMCMGFGGAYAFAQQTPPPEAAGEQMAAEQPDGPESLRVKTTVVVTATRSEAELDKTPLSATVITRQDLDARPLQSIDQQLTLTEGVYVQRFQGFSATDSNVYLRGFNGSSRTLVLLDGQPLNDAFSNAVNWTGLPTSQVESIEVARGPFSSLYGGNALGGVVNIRTRPIDRRSFEGTGEYGTYGSSRLTARYADRFMDRFGFSVGGERFDTEGYNSRRFTATPGAGSGILVTGPVPSRTQTGAPAVIIGEGGRNWLTRSAARLKGEYQAGASTILSLQYLRMDYRYGYDGYQSYLRDAAGNAIDSGAVVFDDGGTLRRLVVTPNSFLQGPGEQHANFYSGTFQHAFAGAATVRVDAGVYHTPSFQFRQLRGGNTLTSGPGTLTDGRRRSGHVNLQYNRSARQHVMTVGSETRHQQAVHSRIALSNWTDKESRGNQTFFAQGRSINQSAYVQDQVALGDRLLLVVGARYDYWRGYDGVSDNFSPLAPRTSYPASARQQFSGKAALGYTLPGDWNLRLSAGNAFRNPTVFDLYAPDITSSGIIFAPNPALTPESVVSWEAGVRKRLGGTSVDAAYYENHVKDLIYRHTDLVRDPSGNFRINLNAGQGRTRGVELGVRHALGAGVEFRGTYSYTNANITSNPSNPAIVGKRVTTIPRHMASGHLIRAGGKWTASLAGRYTGLLFNTDTNTDTTKGVPGSYSPFFVAEASASYALTPRVEPFVTSENLLNRRYYFFYLSPGRTVFGGLRVRL